MQKPTSRKSSSTAESTDSSDRHSPCPKLRAPQRVSEVELIGAQAEGLHCLTPETSNFRGMV